MHYLCNTLVKIEHFNMKAMTKSALARAAGVHRNTLARWLKDPYMQQQLAQFHLPHNCKKIPAQAVKLICEHYVIDID